MKWQGANKEILAGAVAIIIAMIFFWFQSTTLGFYVDPETGGEDFRSWIAWDCVDPFCVWNRMGATMHYITIAGSAMILIMIAAIFGFVKYTKNRGNAPRTPDRLIASFPFLSPRNFGMQEKW
jgi:hypothetical protein